MLWSVRTFLIVQFAFTALSVSLGAAAELKVLCARALEEPVKALVADFNKQGANSAEVTFDTVGGVLAKLKAGAKADVIIVSNGAIGELDKSGVLAQGGRADIALAVMAVTVREGTPLPDISTADAFKKTLLDAASVSYTDPASGGTTGNYLTGLIEKLGIAPEVQKKSVLVRGGINVARAVANGEAALGVTFLSEIVPIKGAKVVGLMPDSLQQITTFAGAVSETSSERTAGTEFVRFARSAAARGYFKSAGLEIPK